MRNLLLHSIFRILEGDGGDDPNQDPSDPDPNDPSEGDDYEFDLDGDDAEMPDKNDFLYNTSSPTTAPVADTTTDTTYGVMLLIAGGAIGIYGLWRYFQYWRYRRDRQLLQMQSERADAVLGDMQMVSAEDEYATDDEEDPELL